MRTTSTTLRCMTCLWNSRSLIALLAALVMGCSAGEPIEPPIDTGGGATDLFIGDSTRTLRLASGQLSREHYLTLSARSEIAIFIQPLDEALRFQMLVDGIDLGVNYSLNYVTPELLASRTDRFSLPAGKTLTVVVNREGSDRTSSPRYRLFAYRVNRAPEHGSGTVILGQVKGDEDIETSADIDEYALAGQVGNDLVGYLANDGPGRGGFFLGFFDKNDNNNSNPRGGVAAPFVGEPLDDSGSDMFTASPGSFVVRVVGGEYNLPSRYRFVIRQGNRAPETAPAVVATNAVISEAFDYTGDMDEFTIHGTPGVLVNIILENNNVAPLFPSLETFGDGVWRRSLLIDNYPPNATTGAIPIPPSGDIGFRVANNRYQTVPYVPNTGRGTYRVRVVQINPGPETASAALTGTDSIIGEQIDDFDDRDEFTLAWPVGGLANIILRTTPRPIDPMYPTKPLFLHLTSLAGDSVQSVLLPYAASLKESGPFPLPAGNYRVRVVTTDGSGTLGAFTGPYAAYIYLLPEAPEFR